MSGDDYREALVGFGLPRADADALTHLFGTVLDGRNAYLTSDVARILGRAPRDFADYARAHRGHRRLVRATEPSVTSWPESASVAAATITTGLFAGLFYTFATAVMVGLRVTDDRTFVTAMRSINARITNGWFLVSFVAPFPLWLLAGAVHLGAGSRPVLPWIAAALGCYLAVVAVTAAVNVPLNDRLAAADDSGRPADLAALRRDFESRWVRWNAARAVLAMAALLAATGALVAHGRLG